MSELDLCQQVASLLRQKQWQLASAESCTGGLIASACTSLPGSSSWFERGFVTYSNAAKIELLGVAPQLIERFGAVSEEVARAMATGALKHSQAQVSLAVTGIAGPDGASPGKPVGTVCFGWASALGLHSQCQHFSGNRAQIRSSAVHHALSQLLLLTAASETWLL